MYQSRLVTKKYQHVSVSVSYRVSRATYPYAYAREIVQFVSRLYRHMSDTYWYCHEKNRIRCCTSNFGLTSYESNTDVFDSLLYVRVPTIIKRYVICICILVNCIMYVSKSYLIPNIIKRYVFVLVRVYDIIMSIMSRIITHI